MLSSIKIYSQQSIDNYGFIENANNSNFRMNSLESNISNYSTTKDWDFSFSLISKLQTSSNLNISIMSLGKRIKDHYLYARFTPGIQQKFIFNSKTEFLVGDTVQNYKTNLSYFEKYGFGYSYNFSDKFFVGASFRYIQQKFSEEYPTVYKDSVQQIIQIREKVLDKNFWRGDIGLQYKLYPNLKISLATQNLFILKDFDKEDPNSDFGIVRKDYNIDNSKGLIIGIDYSLKNILDFKFDYESNHSFVIGSNYNFPISNSFVTIGTQLFHDNAQEPFIAGIFPSISYTNNLFGITFSYLKYFNNRSEAKSLNEFKKLGIRNIQNNFFSNERINLNFNFALSFDNFRSVKFVGIKLNDAIFPTFRDNYLDAPFAIAQVENLSDKKVLLKPSSFIDELNNEVIYSPNISIPPFDTVDVPFFTIINKEASSFDKTKISQAKFILNTSNDEPDDIILKPILVHDANNWDGKVINLRYFVNSDIEFSKNYSNQILNRVKNESNKNNFTPFEIVKILFNEFVKNMTYVSDRRATVDNVQFPSETIELKGGDCDDLSVCFSSILESNGIQTAFLDYKPNGTIGHVTLLINTKLNPQSVRTITNNDRKYFVRKNIFEKEEIWIPIEITSLTNFDNAWNIGSEMFYSTAVDKLGLLKNKVEIIDVF